MALVKNTLENTDTMKDIFDKKFWEKDGITLFHFENDMIIIGNQNKQIPIHFILYQDVIFPIIREDKPTKLFSNININIAGLQLQHFRNRLKFRDIIKKFITLKTYSISKKSRNLYLNKDTVTYKFPIDFNKITKNSKKNYIFENCDKLKTLISKINTKDIIIKEIKSFNSDMNFPDFLEPENDNIYKLKLHLFKKDNYKCIIKFDIDSRYYPLVPPKVQWVSPIISKDNYASLINSKIFSSSWNPVIRMSWLALKLKQALIDRETGDTKDIIFSNKESYFSQDDILIMNFSKAIGRFTSTKPIDIQFNPVDIKNSGKSHWKKGTGYGHTGLKDWSLEDYLKQQSNINSEIIKYMNDINELDTISESNSKYITELCFIEVSGITLMDIEKNTTLYQKYFNLILKLYSTTFNFSKIQVWVENITSLIESINISETTNKDIISIKHILVQLISKINFKPTDNTSKDTSQEYCSIMKPLQFGYNDISKVKYNFSKSTGKPSSTKQMMRIAQEISSLKKSLPLNEESSVWIRWDKQQLTKMQFMISGPKDTPYQDGLFLFDCYFSGGYPKLPPKVLLHTTGKGSVRFNPNLYNCGKVCLSLLGTWSGSAGEKWNEKTSTILQVLVSIQSLILIEQPFFNEPGYEKSIGTKEGDEQNEKYNQNIRQATANWAIKDMIQNPPIGFEEIVLQHFNHKKDKIKTMLESWSSKAYKKYKKNIDDTLKVIQDL